MGKRFVPPVDALNDVTPKRSRRAFSDRKNQSVLRQARRVIKDSYSPDAFEQVGSLKGVVIEVIGSHADSDKRRWKYSSTLYLAGQDKNVKFIEVRFRIPELHAHLPEPVNEQDNAAIRKHPIALHFGDDIPAIGDVVEIDFADKNNFKDAYIASTNISANVSNNSPCPSCDLAEVYNSATPSLNVSQPTGDSQTSTESCFDNNPANTAFSDGIVSTSQIIENTMASNYFVTIEEFNALPEFKDNSSSLMTLANKNVYNVSIQVANESERLQDINRLKSVAKSLQAANIGVYIWASASTSETDKAVKHLTRMVKEVDVSGFFFRGSGTGWSDDVITALELESRLESLAQSYDLVHGYLYMDLEEGSFSIEPASQSTREHSYRLLNTLDAYDVDKLNLSQTPEKKLFHIDGYNFLATDDDPCLDGTRTPERLETEISSLPAGTKVGFLDYSSLTSDKIEIIKGYVDPQDNLQNLLSTSEEAVTPEKTKLETECPEDTQQKEEPTFNSDTETTGSQDVATTSAPANNTAPGSQCSPNASGGEPFSTENSIAPSFRFDSLENTENRLWTTNPGRILNSVIVDFLDRLAQEVYRIIPLTDPLFASTDAKKLRITDGVRTPERQVELMWDKVSSGKKTKQQVLDLYSNCWWAKRVMNAYPNDKPAALAAVNARIAQGGDGHLYGTGVDIGTKHNFVADGDKPSAGSKIYEAQMRQTRFYKAVQQACQILGAKVIAEDYQEHFHITFSAPK